MDRIEDYLSRAYAAHFNLSKEQRPAVVAELRAKMVSTPGLQAAAQRELVRLEGLTRHMEKHGAALGDRCVISGVYLDFLREVMA